ncbi:sigma-70 family RNA polymerase sigma factor [Halobacillus litoralis]|uniref:sigma-70 family RNA polymerase sigma factor n=1 Tax=Halobacillus litoralis TaxID=45668 RepID=UPI001CFC4EC4|nr:sigma-70 family RNA polymerase sigma factor [Halobacillus litoralis]WLR48997.1 sigma-70 family RNA polymerase sigma factor [Halobacillus litoralis]
MKDPILEFHAYQRLIHSSLRHWNLPEPYEDCLQESYLIYLRCVERYEPERSKFSTFFIQSLYRHLQTMHRKNHRGKEAVHFFSLHQKPLEKDPPQEDLLLFDIHHYSSLTPMEQIIFEQSYTGYTVNQIAVLTGKSPSTIKRARKQIKRKVAGCLSKE